MSGMFLFSTVAYAQQGGGIPIRIPVGPTPECINGKTDQIWITMYRVVTTKTSGFLSTDKQADVIFNVQVKSQPQSAQPLSFPLSAKVDISQYQNGQVSLPVEYTLVSGLPLTQKDSGGKQVAYTGFGIDTTLVNLRSRNGLGTALQALSDITSSNKLPIPDSPVTQGASYLVNFANNAVTTDINNKNANDKLTTAALSLNIDPDGTCANGGSTGAGFEQTGVKAIVMAMGPKNSNVIPIDQTTAYCWSADVTPAFVIKAAKRDDGVACSDGSYSAKYQPIGNDYTALLLQRRPIALPGHLGPPTPQLLKNREEIKKAKLSSQALCDSLRLRRCDAAQ
jgi:hypothetical protein